MFELLAQILVGSSWGGDFQSALFHIRRRNVNQEFQENLLSGVLRVSVTTADTIPPPGRPDQRRTPA